MAKRRSGRPWLNPTFEHITAGWATALGISLAVVVISGIVASGGTVPGWEADLFHAINDLPDLLERPMWLVQLAGLLFVPALVAVGAAVARKWWLAGCLVVFVPIKLFVEKAIIKQLVERQRPYITVCDNDPSCANFRDAPTAGLSFVSGHAIIAWGVAGLLWPFLTARWRAVAISVAVLNSVARVYLGAHNVLDVVGGAAAGFAVASVITIAVGAPRNRIG
jgi:membrane-associated phospholipid phosphatase